MAISFCALGDNGGAGATGLIKGLAQDYLKLRGKAGSIAWVCNSSRATQLALFRDYIDIALTYERDQEAIASAEGWSVTFGPVFHDHFVLAGPVLDPAHVRGATSVYEALRRVTRAEALFHSRNDGSATMWKERELWHRVGYRPGEHFTASWYNTSALAPAEALLHADAEGAYLLTDRSTMLSLLGQGRLNNTEAFVEPKAKDDVLMNTCYALYRSEMSETRQKEVFAFLEYLLSARGQAVVASFGADKAGLPLFAQLNEGFARTSIVGRRLPIRGPDVARL